MYYPYGGLYITNSLLDISKLDSLYMHTTMHWMSNRPGLMFTSLVQLVESWPSHMYNICHSLHKDLLIYETFPLEIV